MSSLLTLSNPPEATDSPKSGLFVSFGYTYNELENCGKCVTRRDWKDSHAQKFIKAYQKGLLIRAFDKDPRYRGVQTGWLKLTVAPYQEALADMPEGDVALEGFPELSKEKFLSQFFKKTDLLKPVWVVRFNYSPFPLKDQCQQVDISSPVVAATPKEQATLDTTPCGLSSTSQEKSSNGLPPSTASDSLTHDSLSGTSPSSRTSLFSLSPYQTFSSGEVLARISPRLENVPVLKAIADACFLKESDFCNFSSLNFSYLKTSKDCSAQGKEKTSSKSSKRLQKWGIWGLGSSETGVAMSHKTDPESSVWAFTGDVRITSPKPYKKTLAECLGGSAPINSVSGDPVDQAYTLRQSSFKQGTGNAKHPNTFVRLPAAIKACANEVEFTDEAPSLIAGRWLDSTNSNHARGGKGFAILDTLQSAREGKPRIYESDACSLLSPSTGGSKLKVVHRAPGGDRLYTENAPTLRSLANTNGHQAGSGAMKVREIDGGAYIERPMTAREYENVMGWEPNSTAIGLTADGREIQISETQRKRVLGNGIVPQEITEILLALKPFIEDSVLSGHQEQIDEIAQMVRDIDPDCPNALPTIEASTLRQAQGNAPLSFKSDFGQVKEKATVDAVAVSINTSGEYTMVATVSEQFDLEQTIQSYKDKLKQLDAQATTFPAKCDRSTAQEKRANTSERNRISRLLEGLAVCRKFPHNTKVVHDFNGEGLVKAVFIDHRQVPMLSVVFDGSGLEDVSPYDVKVVNGVEQGSDAEVRQTEQAISIEAAIERIAGAEQQTATNDQLVADGQESVKRDRPSPPVTAYLNPDDIIIDCGTQSRMFEDALKIEDYKRDMDNGEWDLNRLPLPVVFHNPDDGLHYAGDCHQRVIAARRSPAIDKLLFEVRIGSLAEARLFSAKANTQHGLGADNSPAGVRKRIEMFLDSIGQLSPERYLEEFLSVPDLTRKERGTGRFSSRTIARYLRLRPGQDRLVSAIMHERELSARFAQMNLKEGDRVEVITGAPDWINVGELGTIMQLDKKSGVWVKWDEREGAPVPILPQFVQLTDKPKPAPAPKPPASQGVTGSTHVAKTFSPPTPEDEGVLPNEEERSPDHGSPATQPEHQFTTTTPQEYASAAATIEREQLPAVVEILVRNMPKQSVEVVEAIATSFSEEQRRRVGEILGYEARIQELEGRIMELMELETKLQKPATRTDEWYTPPEYVEMAREVLGGIDLDPASNELAQSWIQAKKYFTKDDEGLVASDWYAWNEGPITVWCNPPYGRDVFEWLTTAIRGYQDGDIKSAMLLLNRTGATWYKSCIKEVTAICEVHKRIAFLDENGDRQSSPRYYNDFLYLGEDVEKFIEVFSAIGDVRVLQSEQRRAS
jgi:hypothetical protein